MRHRVTALVVALSTSVLSCRTPDAAAPAAGSLGATRHTVDDVGTPPGAFVACTKRATATDSGEFGPSGGTLYVGGNRLVIPPGALTGRVTISGTVVGDTIAFVKFEPSGLRFRRPAGLILDATDCTVPAGDVPSVAYVNERGQIVERIDAVYSNTWHTVAAPIEHFSGYAIAF